MRISVVAVRLLVLGIIAFAPLSTRAEEVSADPCQDVLFRPEGLSFESSGGSHTLSITAPLVCQSNLSSDSSWLKVYRDPNDASGYLVVADANPGRDRWGTLRYQELSVPVHQLPYSPCSISLPQGFLRSPMAGGTVSIPIQMQGAECRWNAVSNQPWASIAAGAVGYGNYGSIQVDIEPFSASDIRVASVVVNGEEVRIQQIGFNPALPAEVRAIGDAATFNSFELAAGGLASVFGNHLATEIAVASTIPLPTQLGGIRLMMRMGNGQEVAVPLLYVSHRQINLQIPEGIVGPVSIRVDAPGRGSNSYSNTIHPYYPTLFLVANHYTIVTAAGYAHLVLPDGTERISLLADCSNGGSCRPQSVDRGPEGSELYIVLFGTGFPENAILNEYQGPAVDSRLRVAYSGRHKDYVGLQQVNIHVPREVELSGGTPFDVEVRGIRSGSLPVYLQPLPLPLN